MLVLLKDHHTVATAAKLFDKDGENAGHFRIAHGLSLRRESIEARVAEVEGGGVEVGGVACSVAIDPAERGHVGLRAEQGGDDDAVGTVALAAEDVLETLAQVLQERPCALGQIGHGVGERIDKVELAAPHLLEVARLAASLLAILDGTADTEAAGRLQLLAVEVGEMILPRHPHRVVAKRLSRSTPGHVPMARTRCRRGGKDQSEDRVAQEVVPAAWATGDFETGHGRALLEVVEEGGNALQGRFALAFNLNLKLHAGLADATQVLDAVERDHEAHATAYLDGLAEAHLVHTIVDEHGDIAHLEHLGPHIGQEREREITVGDGAPIRTLLGRAVGIDVDPLVVERGVGEEVDAVLIDEKPVGLAELLAKVGGKFVVGRNDELIHVS